MGKKAKCKSQKIMQIEEHSDECLHAINPEVTNITEYMYSAPLIYRYYPSPFDNATPT
jgi:DNA replication protein DnaC